MPVVLFIGRPLASRKGLATFLDAIAKLEDLKELPPYRVWIIGGSQAQVNFIYASLKMRNDFTALLNSNRIDIWGRIENDTLPEFYSRATVTVVPSTFEQFGIVALESMACGTPVIASKTGGLQDIIVDKFTGKLINIDDSITLAGVISGYIRNPSYSIWEGNNAEIWVRNNFDILFSYKNIIELLKNIKFKPEVTFKDSLKSFRNSLIIKNFEFINKVLDDKIISISDFSSSLSTTFKVVTQNNIFVAKLFSIHPSSQYSVYPCPKILNPKLLPSEIIHKQLFMEKTGLTPKIINYSLEHGIIIQEFGEKKTFLNIEEEFETILTLSKKFNESNSIEKSNPILQSYYKTFDDVRDKMDLEAIYKFDIISAKINSCLHDNKLRFSRIHPQIELLRFHLLLNKNIWALPEKFVLRVKGIIEFLLKNFEFIPLIPKLCHGSLKPEHILTIKDKAVTCDLDQASFMVGPYDIIHWAMYKYENANFGFSEIIKFGKTNLKNESDLYFFLFWLVVIKISKSLWGMINGDFQLIENEKYYFIDFYEVMYSLTQL